MIDVSSAAGPIEVPAEAIPQWRWIRSSMGVLTLALRAGWRSRFPSAAEIARRRRATAHREQSAADMRRAAEEFHWLANAKSGGEIDPTT